MNILFSSSELTPFIKTGGLADVVPALAKALAKQKNKVFVVLPAYTTVLKQLKTPKKIAEFVHPVTLERVEVLISDDLKPTKLLLIKNELFEGKPNPYCDAHGQDWQDNFETFSLFSWASAKIAYEKKITGVSALDLVVSNDWQSGLLSVYIKHMNNQHKVDIKSAHIIHNIAFPGVFAHTEFAHLGLPYQYFDVQGMEYHNKISFQKSAINFADKIFTVSPQYAEELMQNPYFGMGFEGILASRKQDFTGIMNGVDYDIWSPQKDNIIAQNYAISSVNDKQVNKLDLLQEVKLTKTQDAHKPLIGMVTRLSGQKGIDVLVDFLKEETDFHQNFNLVMIGTGDAYLENELKQLTKSYPNIAFCNEYNEVLAHKVMAGCDIFFMPSRFEPCGLTQLYAMKYGTIPIVNPVGGLKSSVIPFDGSNAQTALGFYIDGVSTYHFREMFKQVHHIMVNKRTIWQKIKKNAMRTDFSWKKVARLYQEEFNKIK